MTTSPSGVGSLSFAESAQVAVRLPRRGSIVSAYQEAFATLFGSGAAAFAFWKGRVAFFAILEALDIGPGDEVIVPGFTCVVVPNAVCYRGATAVYADIDARTFNIDPASVQARLSSRTKAIIVQHTFGIPEDIDPILALARPRGIVVIEDCAHALGSRSKGRAVGTLGHAAFFSSQWSKPYSTGLGGMAVTADGATAERLARVQSGYARPRWLETGRLQVQWALYQRFFSPRVSWTATKMLRRLSAVGLFVGSYGSEELAGRKPERYEKVMSECQAAWGLRALSELPQRIQRRRSLAALYGRLLVQRGFAPLALRPEDDVVLLRYPLWVKDKRAVLAQARRSRVEIGDWFDAVFHPSAASAKPLGYRRGSCQTGEEAARHVINLPMHSRVGDDEAARTVEFLHAMRERGCV